MVKQGLPILADVRTGNPKEKPAIATRSACLKAMNKGYGGVEFPSSDRDKLFLEATVALPGKSSWPAALFCAADFKEQEIFGCEWSRMTSLCGMP
ncbi:MAG: hypothetical protein ACYC05_07990 [Sulfuricella sp.]|nr:hypothetical protein [Gammaproteobacteria bacterium]